MHKYIDITRFHDFKKNKSFDDILTDVEDKYKISNICNDGGESLYYIADALYFDYKNQTANYEAYIEKGMDARVLMELRKSAIIPLDTDLYDFHTEHCSCSTISEIKEHRIKWLKNFNSDYQDLDWQYYFLIRHTLRKKSIGFIFDFEECYADGDYRLQTNPDDYVRGFVQAHLPEGYRGI